MALAKSTVAADFKMNLTMFDKIMTLYMQQLNMTAELQESPIT